MPASCEEWRLDPSELDIPSGLTKWPRAALAASMAPQAVAGAPSSLSVSIPAIVSLTSAVLCLAVFSNRLLVLV